MRPEAYRRSPQEVDPLSWFAGPAIPRVMALLLLVLGVVFTVLQWSELTYPWLQFVAVLLIAGALETIDLFTLPHRNRFSIHRAIIVLAPAWGGVTLSALAQIDNPVRLEQWWGSIAMGMVVAGLAPYSNAVRVLVLGSVSVAITAGLTLLVFLPVETFWPPASLIVIGVFPVVIGLAVGVGVDLIVVSAILDWAESEHAPAGKAEPASVSREIVEWETVATRVSPFIRELANTGVVTDNDRAIAAQLARQLRDDLVSRANKTWLDTLAESLPLTVLDAQRRADSMTMQQRAALRAMLVAAVEQNPSNANAILIELRGQEDDSTAVALTLDLDLPEGRRVMLLAPQYLTLKTTVDDLRWDKGKSGLRFRLPAH